MTFRLLAIFFVVLVCVCGAFAQAQPGSGVTPEMRTEANGYYQASDWEKAAAAYEKIVDKEAANFVAHYRLGVAFLGLNRNEDAAAHFEKAFAGSPNAACALALARAYARLGKKTEAFAILEKSTKMGGIAPETLTAEKDFAAWKEDIAFKELVQKSDLAVNPCKASPEFRQFDFWIGEWDVKPANGPVVASSSVQLILGQCVIFENWYPQAGGDGKSFNIYDVNDKKWHQSWVDNKGTFTHYIGGVEDGKMVVIADTIVSGTKTLAKMTYSKLPNGDVRQFGENSTDGGKTWVPAFDFIYSLKK